MAPLLIAAGAAALKLAKDGGLTGKGGHGVSTTNTGAVVIEKIAQALRR